MEAWAQGGWGDQRCPSPPRLLAQFQRLRAEVAALGVACVASPFPESFARDLFTDPPPEAFASEADLARIEE
eukprot:58975-Alexandrium_andersonii.AAC.1